LPKCPEDTGAEVSGHFGVIFLREVRVWNSLFLRLTDDRKRCFKRKRDLILRWRCNTKLVLTAITLYWDPRGKMGPWVGGGRIESNY